MKMHTDCCPPVNNSRRKFRFVKRCISILVITGVCAATASAGGGPSGKIVFASASGPAGQGQIWVMNADGSGRHPVSQATSNLSAPALSRDGTRIAFVKRGDVYVMGVTGAKVRRLTFSGRSTEGAPAWSADGRWIAYSSYRAGRSAIWKMRADGGRKTLLAAGRTLDVPSWSPDGMRIAYAGVSGQIWIMNADGSGKHRLTRTASGKGVDWAPSWSPDGGRIAYESNVDTGPRDLTNEIWVIGADGSHPVRLTHNALNDNRPVWSPNGDWILFSSPLPHPGIAHLWLMRPNGKSLHRVTPWAGEQYAASWAR
jgi:Tol biopolymer transport system component